MDDRETFQAAVSAVQKIANELRQTSRKTAVGTAIARKDNETSIVEVFPLDQPASRPLKVLVSWAHRGEDWSAQQQKAWEQQVMEFTTALRSMGIDADIDLFHSHKSDADWTRFGQKAVLESDFVLVAITDAWAERWSGVNSPRLGAGAVVEADALKGSFIRHQAELQKKLKLVLLGEQSPRCIPEDMARFTYFQVDVDDFDTYEDLLRTLTGQPYYDKPELGEVPILPPAVREKFKRKSDRTGVHDELEDYDAVRSEIMTLESAQARKTKPDLATQQRIEVLRAVLNAMSN